MGLRSLFTKPHKEVAIVYDIGSASVGASIIEAGLGTIPKILYTVRIPIQFQREVNAKRFLAFAITALEEATQRLVKEGLSVLHLRHPNRIRMISCTLSSPWLISNTHVVHYQQGHPFAVTPDLISSLVTEEREKFLFEMNDSPRKIGSITTIESQIIGIRQNGYDVSHVQSRSCEKLTIAVHLSAAPSEVIETIKRTIHQHFNFRKITFDSFPLVYFSAIRTIHPTMTDFLCVDVTGEVTDVLIARNGILRDVSSFPLGKHHFARTISAVMGGDENSALGILHSTSAGAGEKEGIDAKVVKALNSIETDWRASFQQTLTGISERSLLPKHIFVTADAEVGDFFTRIISEEEFDTLGVAKERFTAEYVHPNTMEKTVSYAPGVSEDSFLALEAIFYAQRYARELSTRAPVPGIMV